MQNPVLALPIVTTVLAALFATILWRHWGRKRDARYLLWWAIGVTIYGLGTLTEALTTVFGWSEPVFRTWYIAGALLGGWPLATGTVYLLMKKRTADILTGISLVYIAVASAFVLMTPIIPELVEEHRLSGEVMAWQWVRLFSPLVNTYAFVFLVGGAIWSAWRYWRRSDRPGSRVVGNALIAVGAILPGIGGAYTRAGMVEVLYVTELIGIALIWLGYWAMTRRPVPSVHEAQREAPAAEEQPRTQSS